MGISLGVVIVTYNRIEELKQTLPLYEIQSFLPKRIVVVDNCSNDGTSEYLKEWASNLTSGVLKHMITLPENQGGSGGFYAGLSYMQSMEDVDWIWVADDDAYPELDAFEYADKFIVEHKEEINGISAVCGMCEYEGHIASVQRARFQKTIFGKHEMPVKAKVFEKNEVFDVDLYSFVGTILNREKLLKAGLPRKDFFIYQDDYEHAVRMGKLGRIVCYTKIKINHKDNYLMNNQVSWRDYYATRNIVIMYKEHFEKRDLRIRILRRLLVAYVSFNPKKIKVIKEAIKDGKEGKSGLHPVYVPGWKG